MLMMRIGMEIHGIIWDLDGVIVDTGEFHYQAWKRILSEHGISLNREGFRATFGMNNWGVLTTLLGSDIKPEKASEISDQKEVAFRQLIRGRVKLLPGAQELLKILKGASVRQAIASSTPSANLPKHCVVIEDAVVGIEAAKRAGMRSIAVTTTNTAESLQTADLVVDRLDDPAVREFLAV
jgi:beta-phosphoglucomutase-like phosphatase (HAD superfamily)